MSGREDTFVLVGLEGLELLLELLAVPVLLEVEEDTAEEDGAHDAKAEPPAGSDGSELGQRPVVDFTQH